MGCGYPPHKTNYFKPEALLEEYKSLRWLVANGDIVASKGDSFTEVNLYEYGVKYTGAISDANNTFVSALNLTKSITWQTLEDVPRSVLHSLIQLQNKGVIELYLRESPMWFEQSNVFLQLRIPIESPLTPTEPPELQYYDTIIGVGDSITDGEFRLSKMFFNNGQPYPFRGVTFDTGAVPGTTLSYMVDNISNFTSKANGRTLFIVRAGINDCNTYLSANGVGDGAAGEVTSWNDLTTSQKDTTIALYIGR